MFCTAPPGLGEDISLTTVTVGEDWQRNETNVKCDQPEHFLFVSEIDFPPDTDVKCVPNILFGGIFPFWDIPGLNYPSVSKLYCVNAMECRDFWDLSDRMNPLGLMDNFDQQNWVVGDTFHYFCSMDGSGGEWENIRQLIGSLFASVHKKFVTNKDAIKDDTVFYFRSNHSLLERDFQGRVFPKDVFTVTFSNTRAQDDKTLVFTFSESETTATGEVTQTWTEKSIFEFGSLNDFMISFRNNSIEFTNEKMAASIIITGIFDMLRFIGFHSEVLTTWVLQDSRDQTDSFTSRFDPFSQSWGNY